MLFAFILGAQEGEVPPVVYMGLSHLKSGKLERI